MLGFGDPAEAALAGAEAAIHCPSHLREASPSICLVSASDKVYNARAILGDYREIGEALWERFTAKKDGTLWYYRRLVEVFLETGPRRLAEELDRIVAEIEQRAG